MTISLPFSSSVHLIGSTCYICFVEKCVFPQSHLEKWQFVWFTVVYTNFKQYIFYRNLGETKKKLVQYILAVLVSCTRLCSIQTIIPSFQWSDDGKGNGQEMMLSCLYFCSVCIICISGKQQCKRIAIRYICIIHFLLLFVAGWLAQTILSCAKLSCTTLVQGPWDW